MKGICFKEELFNKTIEGSKTQTRRIIKPHPDNIASINKSLMKNDVDYYLKTPKGTPCPAISFLTCEKKYIKPKLFVGDPVFLREPYCQEATVYSSEEGFMGYQATGKYLYKYSGDNLSVNDPSSPFGKWKNKLFMPAKAARYFIKITSVRAERLQNISDEDCIKEGIVFDGSVYMNKIDKIQYLEPRAAYRALINSINGKDTWESNPFVWVYDYELTTKPQDHE